MSTFTQTKTDDPVGNRTMVDDSANAGPEYYGTNGLNQYTGFNVAGGTGMAYYDANGNLTGVSSSQGTRTFSYDALNRLTGTTQSGPYNNLPGAPVGTQDTQVYYYDARNRCVARVVTKWAASEWMIERVLTTYTYDGWNVIETFSAYSSPGQPQGSQSAEYVHGANVDEIVRAEVGGVTTYHHHDALGSVIALTNGNGAVVERYKYDVFGQPTFLAPDGVTVRAESDYGNKFLFTGREWLPLSGGYHQVINYGSSAPPTWQPLPGGNQVGLYDYRNRAYTALLGRFMQTDPIRFDAGDANLYRYVGNSPQMYSDPTGEISGGNKFLLLLRILLSCGSGFDENGKWDTSKYRPISDPTEEVRKFEEKLRLRKPGPETPKPGPPKPPAPPPSGPPKCPRWIKGTNLFFFLWFFDKELQHLEGGPEYEPYIS